MWRSTKTFDTSGRGRRTRAVHLAGALLLLLAVPAVAQDVFIEKSTNGQDADSAPGPTVVNGDPVNWSYLVTAGVRDLQDIVVSDDQGVAVFDPIGTSRQNRLDVERSEIEEAPGGLACELQVLNWPRSPYSELRESHARDRCQRG